MRRRLTRALGALALGWLAGRAPAADPANDVLGAAPAAAPAPEFRFQSAGDSALGGPSGGNASGGFGQFIGGAGVYIMKPYLERDRAWVKTTGATFLNQQRFNGATGTNDFASFQSTDFSYDFEGAPHFWLGWVSDIGLGVRARYFHFEATGHAPPATLTGLEDAHDDAISPALPLGNDALNDTLVPEGGPGEDILTVTSKVRIDVWDVEAIDEIRAGSWLLTVAGGVRHADLVEFYDATRRYSLDTTGADVRTLHSSNRFTGIGPSLAAEGRYLIGNTGLALYGTARGAYLFGDRREIAYAVSTLPTSLAAILPPNARGNSFFQKEESMPMTEGELGVEWAADLGGYRPFVQVGVIGQAWFNALTNNDHLTEPPSSSETSNGLFGLFGINISAGVNF